MDSSTTGYSLSDIAAIIGNKDGDGFLEGNGIIILILFFILLGGNGLFGGSASAQTVTNDFLYTNLANQLNNASTRVESALNTGFTSTNQNMNSGFNAVQAQGYQIDRDVLAQTTAINQTLCSGFSGVNANINSNANAINNNLVAGFNSVTSGISNLGAQMAQQCCDLKTALHSEGEMTRALIQSDIVQSLRDKVAEKDNELQSAQLTLANAAQTQNLLSALGNYVPTSNTGCGCSGCSY